MVDDMQAQYNWITDQIAQGKTVLAYDRRVPKARVYKVRDMYNVNYLYGDLIINGMNARGWTFAAKPEVKK